MSAMDQVGLINTNVIIEILELNNKKSKISTDELKTLVINYVNSLSTVSKLIKCKNIDDERIKSHIEEITISGHLGEAIDDKTTTFFTYNVTEHRAEIETIENDYGTSGEEVAASNHWILPSREFQGLWESLIYQHGLKENILQFAKTIMLFAQRNIDMNIISCNKLVLLHGPPGTGKTSLCKALAQKLSIHLKHLYMYTHLFEINSHSLFSKWFSESGKLVLKLFGNIKEVAEHAQSFVIILIDEVESIAYARDTVSANEPSDSLRVVNAVLTQLDQLRTYTNVLVLTTSNLTSTIDLAFIDRADLKQFIGEPSIEAIYEIFAMAIQELISANIIADNGNILPYDLVSSFEFKDKENAAQNSDTNTQSRLLLDVASLSHGLSGRTLRKMPFLAHAWFIRTDHTALDNYLKALKLAVQKHLNDSQTIINNKI